MSIFTSEDGIDIGYNYGRKPTTTTAFITATIKVQVAISDLSDSDIEKLTEQDVKDAIEDECTLDYEMVDWDIDSTEEEDYDPEPDYE